VGVTVFLGDVDCGEFVRVLLREGDALLLYDLRGLKEADDI
jgi:hypothetical protein